MIKYLLNLGDDCPFVFAATHFHEVLNPLMLAPTLPISFVHMAVMITTDSGNIVDPTNQEGVETPEATFDPGKSLVRPGENVTYLFKWVVLRWRQDTLMPYAVISHPRCLGYLMDCAFIPMRPNVLLHGASRQGS